MRRSKIVGTGMYVPKNIITNGDLTTLVDTSDEWITSRTGIKERRISRGEDTSDLGTKAANMALKNSGLKGEDIDMIIFATLTSETLTPSCACIVQKNIGAVNATAFDVNAACSGFIYALTIADSFIKSNNAKKVLVIGAEVLSKITNWRDRNTCVLFGDGAGAVVLSHSEEEGILSFYTKSVGEKGDCLKCESIKVKDSFLVDSPDLNSNYIKMEGREVFKFATTAIIEAIEKTLEAANLSIEDIKYIVPHQANYRIIDFAAKRLKLDMDKFYVNLDRYGNTSSASIPIALHEMNEKGMFKKGDYVIMVGFGGGLTYGAIALKW